LGKSRDHPKQPSPSAVLCESH